MDGFGLAYMPEDVAQPRLAKGRLKRVLDDWCPRYSGYHLYYTEPPAHPGFHPIGRSPSVPEMYAAIPAALRRVSDMMVIGRLRPCVARNGRLG
jgi:DNA-binding transcriptional LysR family regulator